MFSLGSWVIFGDHLIPHLFHLPYSFCFSFPTGVGPNTKVGVATFYSTIHFYYLKRALQKVAHRYSHSPSPYERDYPLGVLRGISRGISLLKES
ncbi:hypothetical protein OROMI_023745 [Orobanche minor]